MKKCSRCKEEKNENEFYKYKRSKDGLWCYCRLCVSEMGKIERSKRPEFFKQKSKIYRLENIENLKEWHKKNYSENRERKLEIQKNYYWNNREEILKRESERKKTETYRQKAKDYREKNKERLKLQQEAHKMVSYAIKLGVLKRPIKCEMCEKTDEKLEGHHENYDKPLEVQWICKQCHVNHHTRGN